MIKKTFTVVEMKILKAAMDCFEGSGAPDPNEHLIGCPDDVIWFRGVFNKLKTKLGLE